MKKFHNWFYPTMWIMDIVSYVAFDIFFCIYNSYHLYLIIFCFENKKQCKIGSFPKNINNHYKTFIS